LSTVVRKRILERHPELREVPAGGTLDESLPPPPEFSWEGLGHVIQAERSADSSSSSQTTSTSEAYTTWPNYVLAIGAEFMQTCRARVHRELGYTCSAGIAHNKMLAKICSSYRKPNAQTIVPESAIPTLLHSHYISKVPGLGRKLGQHIKDAYSVTTIGELWHLDLGELQRELGAAKGTWLYQAIRGTEYSPSG